MNLRGHRDKAIEFLHRLYQAAEPRLNLKRMYFELAEAGRTTDREWFRAHYLSTKKRDVILEAYCYELKADYRMKRDLLRVDFDYGPTPIRKVMVEKRGWRR